jgi:hypothetical protein
MKHTIIYTLLGIAILGLTAWGGYEHYRNVEAEASSRENRKLLAENKVTIEELEKSILAAKANASQARASNQETLATMEKFYAKMERLENELLASQAKAVAEREKEPFWKEQYEKVLAQWIQREKEWTDLAKARAITDQNGQAALAQAIQNQNAILRERADRESLDYATQLLDAAQARSDTQREKMRDTLRYTPPKEIVIIHKDGNPR